MAAALLLGITAVVDRVAAHFAEKAIAARLQTVTKATPTVTITGWPFLTQLVAHRLDEVDASTTNFITHGVTLARVDLQLYGAWRNDLNVTADRVEATVSLSLAELQRLAGSRVTFSAAKDGLHVAGTALGQKIVGTATITIVAGKLHVVPHITSPASATLPAIDVPVPPLPWGVTVTAVDNTTTGLNLHGTARNVDLMKP